MRNHACLRGVFPILAQSTHGTSYHVTKRAPRLAVLVDTSCVRLPRLPRLSLLLSLSYICAHFNLLLLLYIIFLSHHILGIRCCEVRPNLLFAFLVPLLLSYGGLPKHLHDLFTIDEPSLLPTIFSGESLGRFVENLRSPSASAVSTTAPHEGV
jgi:hypothetical protein